MPVFSFDYFFMGQDDGKCLPMLAVRCHGTRVTGSHAVPCKGPDPYAVKALLQDLRRLGHRRLIFKCDGEPAILALKEKVIKEATWIEFIPEESPITEHESNGTVESCIRELKKDSCNKVCSRDCVPDKAP